ncbi:hypothetical protein [Shewanella colwelliana]|uniref:hypothetical protein n=1 Tax=Shewanella colwelliana TaxID=23 RepID=UPI00048E3819|nr:hypothetical protein [Shewanella colwelliana]
MKKSEISAELTKQCLHLYLKSSSPDFFNQPSLYSPLYRILYESLIKNEEPPIEQVNHFRLSFDKEKIDLECRQCSTSFDRYLVHLYPNRFEASNPLKIDKKDLTVTAVQSYLNKAYGLLSIGREAYNLNHEINKALFLLPKKKVAMLTKQPCSMVFKFLTLSYKLSSINKQWRELIKYRDIKDYIDPENKLKHKQPSMDNIVTFNLLDNAKARLNSAIVSMFYFEIDQGKGDGDITESRNIALITYAYQTILDSVTIHGYKLVRAGFDNDTIKDQFCSLLTEQFTKLRNSIPSASAYQDEDQALADELQTAMLKNIASNFVLAKLLFERELDYHPIASGTIASWVSMHLGKKAIASHVEEELNLNSGSFDVQCIAIAEMLASLLVDKGVIRLAKQVMVNMLCLVLGHINKSGTFYLKGNIQGLKKNQYNVMKELRHALYEIQRDNHDIGRDQAQRLLRPTTLHFIEFALFQIHWAIQSSALNPHSSQEQEYEVFKKFRENIYMATLDIYKLTQFDDHRLTLKTTSLFIREFLHPELNLYTAHFDNLPKALGSHIERSMLIWPYHE